MYTSQILVGWFCAHHNYLNPFYKLYKSPATLFDFSLVPKITFMSKILKLYGLKV